MRWHQWAPSRHSPPSGRASATWHSRRGPLLLPLLIERHLPHLPGATVGGERHRRHQRLSFLHGAAHSSGPTRLAPSTASLAGEPITDHSALPSLLPCGPCIAGNRFLTSDCLGKAAAGMCLSRACVALLHCVFECACRMPAGTQLSGASSTMCHSHAWHCNSPLACQPLLRLWWDAALLHRYASSGILCRSFVN